jgi:hypothetical protein
MDGLHRIRVGKAKDLGRLPGAQASGLEQAAHASIEDNGTRGIKSFTKGVHAKPRTQM